MVNRRTRVALGIVASLVLTAAVVSTQSSGKAAVPKVTSPKEHFGFNIGDDYQLATYSQLTEYWKKIDRESDRMVLQEIGKTAEGRPHLMAVITAPANFRKLDRYKEISQRLAHAEGLTDDEARMLAAEGKAIVWIDGGLHATEVLGAHQLIDFVHRMLTQNDAETLRILNDVVILAVHANPDGMELVSSWYMREPDPQKRNSNDIPRLYQKYVGHDNNRDFYMSNQPETENMNRVMYREWFPQIVYNHHQTGPEGTVMFAPPFRDPFNYVYDPLIPLGLDLVGAAMHGRFAAEGKPGVTMRKGSNYSTWWNGGLRTTPYFHNMIGLLTETIGNPTPTEIPFLPEKQLPNADLPYPIAPQVWHFKQSIDYSWTANRAVLDLASKHREDFLFNLYQMGRNSIRKGSQDTWTASPKRVTAAQSAFAKDQPTVGGMGGRRARAVPQKYYDAMRAPELRDPRGYVIPSDQPDFLTATKFVNTLIKNGITVHRATAAFDVGGKSRPAGSYVVKTAQAFRPYVLDMFEPQDHPNDFAYPGGPPLPPYDSTGWTLAYQMGVQFDRVLDAFDGPFEKIPDVVKAPAGQLTSTTGATGYVFSHEQNDAFIAVNRLLKGNEDVFWLSAPTSVGGRSAGPGTFYVAARPTTQGTLQALAGEIGLNFQGVTAKPSGDAVKLRPIRIGLWDRYGGSIPSGWMRWIFEKYEFPFEVVYPQAIDAGNLSGKYDVLVFVTGAIPARDGATGGGDFFGAQPAPDRVAPEIRPTLGNLTVAKSVPIIKKFIEDGGTVLTIGTSTVLAHHLGLPVADALVEKTNGTTRPLPQERFYIPGSLLQVAVDNAHPLAHGAPSKLDVFYDESPAFELRPDAGSKGVRAVAWFDSPSPLRSGWAWGQHYLDSAVAVVEAKVGKGELFLYGPEMTFRAQPHGTFKLIFNGLYYGPAVSGGKPAASTAGQ
ncbi:MAG: M14 metallopeptidase family protein [Vicinamibacterales bacterium]